MHYYGNFDDYDEQRDEDAYEYWRIARYEYCYEYCYDYCLGGEYDEDCWEYCREECLGK